MGGKSTDELQQEFIEAQIKYLDTKNEIASRKEEVRRRNAQIENVKERTEILKKAANSRFWESQDYGTTLQEIRTLIAEFPSTSTERIALE